jgi:hypothetical protein
MHIDHKGDIALGDILRKIGLGIANEITQRSGILHLHKGHDIGSQIRCSNPTLGACLAT